MGSIPKKVVLTKVNRSLSSPFQADQMQFTLNFLIIRVIMYQERILSKRRSSVRRLVLSNRKMENKILKITLIFRNCT